MIARCGLALFLSVVTATVAQAEVVVDLIRETPPPFGGSLDVGVFLRQDPSDADHLLRVVQFDLTVTQDLGDLGLSFPAPHNGINFWDFTSLAGCAAVEADCGDGYVIDDDLADAIPGPNLLWIVFFELQESSERQINLPGDGNPVKVGVITVNVPAFDGTYLLDVVNAGEADADLGAVISWGFGTESDPLTEVRANTGGITGGTLDICVGIDCELPCGDGVLDPDEECDDGNTENCDACDSECVVEECGNGKTQCNEACDDGSTVDCGPCNRDCTGPGMMHNPPEPERLIEAGPVNAKNRFLSIKPVDTWRPLAIRVRFVDLPSPFDKWEYAHPQRVGPGDYFVGEPHEVCENSGQDLDVPAVDCSIFAGPTRTFWAASLLCGQEAAHLMDWRGICDAGTCVGGLNEGEGCLVEEDCVEIVHLYHEGLVPGGIYDVQVANSSCLLEDEGSYSAALTMTQSAWGDVCGPGSGGACSGVADGTVDVTNDVLGVLDKFQNVNNLQKSRADLEPGDDGASNGPDFNVNVANDVLYCLDAFTGASYPFAPGDPCNPG